MLSCIQATFLQELYSMLDYGRLRHLLGTVETQERGPEPRVGCELIPQRTSGMSKDQTGTSSGYTKPKARHWLDRREGYTNPKGSQDQRV